MPRQFRLWDRKRLAARCSYPWALRVCCRSLCRGFRQGWSWENASSFSLPKWWNGARRRTSGSTPCTTSLETNGASFPAIFRRSTPATTQKRQLDKKPFLLPPPDVHPPPESPPLEVVALQASKNARHL